MVKKATLIRNRTDGNFTSLPFDIAGWASENQHLIRALMKGEAFAVLGSAFITAGEAPQAQEATPEQVAPAWAPTRPPLREVLNPKSDEEKIAGWKTPPVTINVFQHFERTKSVQVSLEGNPDEAVWVPRSMCVRKRLGSGWFELTLPKQIAVQKGLI